MRDHCRTDSAKPRSCPSASVTVIAPSDGAGAAANSAAPSASSNRLNSTVSRRWRVRARRVQLSVTSINSPKERGSRKAWR